MRSDQRELTGIGVYIICMGALVPLGVLMLVASNGDPWRAAIGIGMSICGLLGVIAGIALRRKLHREEAGRPRPVLQASR